MSHFNHQTTAEETGEFFNEKIKGKTIVITGGTWGGIGTDTARVLVKHEPKLVIITGRKDSVLEESISNIRKETPDAKIKGVIMDLSSFDSVREAADEINSLVDQIDVLINNAGVMAIPYQKSKDGYEMQFATNHLGHFLFTSLLKEKLFKSNTPRVVNLSSSATFRAPVLFDDINFTRGVETYTPMISYGQTKTANILFTRELYDRYSKSNNLLTYAVHPGVVMTNLGRNIELNDALRAKDYWGNQRITDSDIDKLYFKNVGEGSSTSMVAAFNDYLPPASYLADCQDKTSTLFPYATDKSNAEKLWKVSEDFIGSKF